jgi:hypothetical protein
MDDLKNAAALAFMLGIAGVVVYPFVSQLKIWWQILCAKSTKKRSRNFVKNTK